MWLTVINQGSLIFPYDVALTPKLCAMTKRKEGPGVVADARAFPSGAMRRTDSLHREECLSVC